MRSASEGRRYIITPSLNGWAHPCIEKEIIHDMETLSVLPAFCVGESTGKHVIRSLERYVIASLNKLLKNSRIAMIWNTATLIWRLWYYVETRLSLQWRHNGCDGVSNHQRLDCLLNLLFRRRSKKTSKLRVTGLCEGNSPVTGEFPTQKARNAEKGFHWMTSSCICPFQYPAQARVEVLQDGEVIGCVEVEGYVTA